jgi:TRAP transporter TAXI family solute receptor
VSRWRVRGFDTTGLPIAIAIAALAGVGCDSAPAAERRIALTIATGGPGGAFYPMGKALAALYAERIPGVETTLLTGGSTQNVQAVQGRQAALGFTQADVAYVAYRRGTESDPRPFSDLRGVAMLWVNTVHVAVPRTSAIDSPGDLAGRRVAVGTRGSGTETLARIVLESYGLPYEKITPLFLSFVEIVELTRRGELDAAFVVGGLPADALNDLSKDPGVRVLPVPRAQVRRMRAQYPFLQPVVVPAGTYPGVGAVETVGVASLLVSHREVDEDLVYRMTRELFDDLPRLREVHAAVGLMDPEQAPATPIPLHPGAARYYRERQLTR